jgi:hypothetical protein
VRLLAAPRALRQPKNPDQVGNPTRSGFLDYVCPDSWPKVAVTFR